MAPASVRPGLLCALLVGIALRVPALMKPVWNVDEAFTAVTASVILDGGVPYRDAVDHRGPLTGLLYAFVFAVAGRYAFGALHVSQAILVAATTVLVARLGSAIAGGRVGLLSAWTFALLSVLGLPPKDSYAFHTEWTLALFSTAGALVIAGELGRRPRPTRGAVAGLLYGLGFLSKQPAALDAAAAIATLGLAAARDPTRRGALGRLGLALVGGFLATAAACVGAFGAMGGLDAFVYYFWRYNTEIYMAALPEGARGDAARQALVTLASRYNLGAFALTGTVCALVSHRRAAGGPGAAAILPVTWAAAALVGAALSGRNFEHYYIQAFPPVCILVGWALDALLGGLRGPSPAAPSPGADPVAGHMHEPSSTATSRGTGGRLVGFFVVATIVSGGLGWTRLLGGLLVEEWMVRRTPAEVLAAHIRETSRPSDSVFVWGFMPEVYVLSDRRCASRFIYTTFVAGLVPGANEDSGLETDRWMVPGAMDSLLEDLDRNRPLVVVDTAPSGVHGFDRCPIGRYLALADHVARHYTLDDQFAAGPAGRFFRLHRRREAPRVQWNP